MTLLPVNSPQTARLFIEAGKLPYVGDKEWICPLDADIEKVFNPQLNINFNGGNAQRWVLVDANNKVLGRVAAFYTPQMKNNQKKIGGMGFFECSGDQKAAHLLMDTCKTWLQQHGFEGMDGPINFGEKDKYWGLMVEGFKNPSYQENYHPPHYKDFFESYGFEKLIEQSTSEVTKATFGYERLSKLGARVLQNPRYRFEHFRKSEMKRFAADFTYIYNLAWQHHDDFVPLSEQRAEQLIKEFLPIVMEDVIWFAYADGEPAGFYVNLIDVNQIFKPLKGKFGWWQKLQFYYYLKTKPVNRVRGIAYGIIPKYHNLGIDTGMIMKFHEALQKHPLLQYVEMAWIGDFNPKMHSLLHAIGAKRTKVHYTYRLIF